MRKPPAPLARSKSGGGVVLVASVDLAEEDCEVDAETDDEITDSATRSVFGGSCAVVISKVAPTSAHKVKFAAATISANRALLADIRGPPQARCEQ
ncbi:hypothetical protein [Amycolatopsis keratiniphila]|uniref:hypothetical protein n=1 Tax=Amycolatopsis keratiniphila TaxID=129921 RepID=UPI0012F8DFDE|nr:hypothetical protein [Amycolatopsis keratiniphila]